MAETLFTAPRTFDYTYDAAGRLDTVALDSVQISDYDYDANGNRTLHTINGSTMVAAAYDDQDRLLTYGSATYTYGDNGELQTRTDGADVTTYAYDPYGNLTSVVLPDTTVIDYVHDANNRRIGRRVNGVLTQGLLYKDGLNPVAELNGAGTVVSLFVYGSKAHVPDAMISGGVTYRILTDHLGSVRAVVHSGTGAILQQLEYDEFGVVLMDTNPGFQPFGFAGGLYDAATGLVRFGARDYDAAVGRWTTKDPLGFGGGANHYAYVGNNPTSFIDPTGLVRWGQSHDGPAQYAGGPSASNLGILAARAGYGAASMVPLAAANGYGADADVSSIWSGLFGASYNGLLPGGVAEAAGSSLPGGGNANAGKWQTLAGVSGVPELFELSAASPLWRRALDLLKLSDGVSQTLGDVGRPLREQLATDLVK